MPTRLESSLVVARVPSPDALDAAQTVLRRVGDRRTSAPLRRRFVERKDPSTTPPLVRLLRGGRGGAVRLKLELSFLWLAAAAPHDLNYPARAWAQLLDLPDPQTKGARRIQDATQWLEANAFITTYGRGGGYGTIVRLRSETGNGDAYELPGRAYNRLRGDPIAADPHRYVQLPNALWTSGWLAVLSGPALAMLLVLLLERGAPKDVTAPLWFSPRQADLRYGLSEDTRSKGLTELRAALLIETSRRSISPDTFDFRRLRNVHHLHLDRLEEPARIPTPQPNT